MTPRTILRAMVGLTITLLSLPLAGYAGDANIAATSSPASIPLAALGPSLLPSAAPVLPAAPVRLAAVRTRPANESRDLHRWKLSLVPLAASQALDVSSSWGMRELNPVLAGPDGRFGIQAASIKLGVAGAFVAVQYLIVKKYPHTARAFQKINWSGAALTSSFAAHNYMIR